MTCLAIVGNVRQMCHRALRVGRGVPYAEEGSCCHYDARAIQRRSPAAFWNTSKPLRRRTWNL